MLAVVVVVGRGVVPVPFTDIAVLTATSNITVTVAVAVTITTVTVETFAIASRLIALKPFLVAVIVARFPTVVLCRVLHRRRLKADRRVRWREHVRAVHVGVVHARHVAVRDSAWRRHHVRRHHHGHKPGCDHAGARGVGVPGVRPVRPLPVRCGEHLARVRHRAVAADVVSALPRRARDAAVRSVASVVVRGALALERSVGVTGPVSARTIASPAVGRDAVAACRAGRGVTSGRRRPPDVVGAAASSRGILMRGGGGSCGIGSSSGGGCAGYD